MRQLIQQFLKSLERAKYGELTLVTPEGNVHNFKGEQPGVQADITIHNWNIGKYTLTRSDIGLGESYFLGYWDSRDLPAFLIYCCQNQATMHGQGNMSFITQLLAYLYDHFVRMNTRFGSKRNIIAHYDISNSFYRSWLDQSMTYSSALRQQETDTLADAQQHKNLHILDKLNADGASILDIGCGWGSFAVLAHERGAQVTGITISDKQFAYCQQHHPRVKVLQQDYRDVTEQYDYVVSIEMIEAVGEHYWQTYFEKIKSSLTSGGKAIIQAITIDDERFEQYRLTSDYIRHHVFPGGMLISKNKFKELAQQSGFEIKSLFEFGQDYVWTLNQWLKNFTLVEDKLLANGYKQQFLRAWEFYLAICIASFATERTNVMQVELQS